jgi:hypothetical protein
MAISLGQSDFSWLGNLPDVMDTARIKQSERNLGSVDFNDPAAVSRRAGQLIAIGDMEGALKIQQAAQSARALNEQIAQRHAWEEYHRKILAGGGLPEPLTPPLASPTPLTATPGAPPSAAPPSMAPEAPLPFSPVSATPAPTSLADLKPQLPPSLGAVGRMSPSDAIIAAAQAGMNPAQQALPQYAPRYAQAGGVTPEPTEPPPLIPPSAPAGIPGMPGSAGPGIPGITSGPVAPNLRPAPGPAAPAAPGAPATPMLASPSLSPAAIATTLVDPSERASQQIKRYQMLLMGLPPNSPGAIGMYKALSAGLDAALANAKPDPELRQYLYDQNQNVLQGLPIESRADWRTKQATAAGTAGEVIDYYKNEFYKPARTAEGVLNQAASLLTVANDKNFVSGIGAQEYGKVANTASSMLRIGQNLGIFSADDAKGLGSQLQALLKDPTQTAALQGLANGIANQAIVGLLGGSLGRSISDADRNFIAQVAPTLMQTKEGYIALAGYLRLISQHAVEADRTALQYRRDARQRANVPDMIDAVNKFGSEHRMFMNDDGTLTKTGQEIQGLVDKISGGSPAPAPTGAPTTYDKATKLYEDVTGKTAPALPSSVSDAAYATGGAVASGLKNVGVGTAKVIGNAMLGSADTLVGPGIVRAIPEAIQAASERLNPPDYSTRPPGPGPVVAQSAADRLVGLASDKAPDVGSMISLRQSIPASQAPAVQAAVIQKMGTGPSGDFDPATWAKSYSDLSTKAKVGLYGGNTPGSLRSNLEDISSGKAVETLSRALPGPVIAQALADPAGASALAAWSRSYNMLQQTGMTPQTIARFKMASDNLRNNIGGDFVYTDLLPPKKAPPSPVSRGPQGGPFAGVPGSAARTTPFGNVLQIPEMWQR